MTDTASLDAAATGLQALLATLKTSNARLVVGVDTGAADAVTVTPTPAVSAYGVDLVMLVDIAHVNATTTPTIAVSGLAALPIKWADGSALKAGDLSGKALLGFSVSAGVYTAKLLYSGSASPTMLARIAALLAAGNAIYLPTSRAFYVNPGAGSDANDGLTPGTAFATIEKVIACANGGQILNIYLCANATLHGAIANGIPEIAFGSYGGRYTLTFGATGLVNNAGGTASNLVCNSPTTIYFNNVDVAQAAIPTPLAGVTVSASIQMGLGGRLNFGGQTLTRDGSCAVPLIAPNDFTVATFSGCTFSAGGGGTWPGNIFVGVSSGGNPNSLWNIKSNITSA